jgi:hypothetical protein
MQNGSSPKTIPDDELLRRLAALVASSRPTEADLVPPIAEVEARRLYARDRPSRPGRGPPSGASGIESFGWTGRPDGRHRRDRGRACLGLRNRVSIGVGCSPGLPPWGRPFRVCVPYDPSACSAVITATSAKSWTEQPRETSFAGLLRPWKIGPIALAPPRRSVIL